MGAINTVFSTKLLCTQSYMLEKELISYLSSKFSLFLYLLLLLIQKDALTRCKTSPEYTRAGVYGKCVL